MIFGDRDKKFELEGDILRMFTDKNYNVDLANLLDEKLMFELAKAKFFVEIARGNESFRDKTLIMLLKSPGIIVSASGV